MLLVSGEGLLHACISSNNNDIKILSITYCILYCGQVNTVAICKIISIGNSIISSAITDKEARVSF